MLRVAWSETYVLRLPPTHRFPMSKYELLPQQLLHEGTITEANLFRPGPVSHELVLATHDPAYFEKLLLQRLNAQEIRRTGFPMSEALIARELAIVNGTIHCTLFALEHGIAMNIAGGTHHAFADRGEGYCLLNDQAIAANYLISNGLAKRILIVDLDVHQGNGTARLFRSEERVFTFSMHGANNFPMVKETSDLDVALPDHTDDRHYLKTLDRHLKEIVSTFQPEFMFFQSGVDVLATDKLGRLALSREGCRERDRLVLRTARENRIPLVASMGGGYSPDFRDILEAHANTYRIAQEIYF